MPAYMEKILRVNLTEGSLRSEPLDMTIARMYLGGKGYATAMIYKKLKKCEREGILPQAIDPLGEHNDLIFATGPATGISGFPEAGRFHVMTTKSPLTGSIGSGNSGGKFGPFIKFSGYDIIAIEGISPTPVYLEIIDGNPQLKDASDLWGMTSFDTTKSLR